MNSVIRSYSPLFCLFFFLSIVCTLHAQRFEKTQKHELNKKEYEKYKKRLDKYYQIMGEGDVQSGMFSLIVYKNHLLLGVPKKMLKRDLLLAAKVSQTSDNKKVAVGAMQIPPKLIYFSLENDQIHLNLSTDNDISDINDTITVALNRTELASRVASFDILANDPVGSLYIIDVTSFFSKELPYVSPMKGVKVGRLNEKATVFKSLKVFPKNMSILTQLYYDYAENKDPFTVIIQRSILLLRKTPILPRLADNRVGYYTVKKIKYASVQPTLEKTAYITRWDMRPKRNNFEFYTDGEIIIPQKPIEIWIDNAFPKQIQEYIKKGIEDWQSAFEKIGFRSAIVAKSYPESGDFSSEDIRHTCFRMLPSDTTTPTSTGPLWVDPRSGEIIQGDITFSNSLLNMLHKWRFVQTAAVDKKARAKIYDEQYMGELIRYMAAHEVGHLLGLEDNMKASHAVKVSDLRTIKYTNRYGTTPSIMDYAKFNYVAQPKDGITNLLPPHLGRYDDFAIAWGYKPILNARSPKEEKPTLNKWITDKNNNPVYQYKKSLEGSIKDPTLLSESLGDNVIEAGTLGINNLKIITKNLLLWTLNDNIDNYSYTLGLYDEILKQYNRYLDHASSYIGGVNEYDYTPKEQKNRVIPVSSKKQKTAIKFVINELTTADKWLFPPDLIDTIGPQHLKWMKIQEKIITHLLSNSTLLSLALHEGYSKAYTVKEYLQDLFVVMKTQTVGNKNDDTDKNINKFKENVIYNYIIKMKQTIREQKILQAKNKENKVFCATIIPLLLQQLENYKKLITSEIVRDNEFFSYVKIILEEKH